jgi:hypothetical protein
LEQMPAASACTQDLACGGDLEALGNRFARLAACDGLWHGKRGKKLTHQRILAMKSFEATARWSFLARQFPAG